MSSPSRPRRFARGRLPLLLAALLTPYAASAADAPQVQLKPDGALQWVGPAAQVGIGYDSATKLRGEVSGVFAETAHSAYLGSAWLANRGGGLKFGYQYQPAADAQANVRKFFIAADQNEQHDRKLTLGGGLESQHWFGTGYASRSLTGQRLVDYTSLTSTSSVSGQDNGRPYNDTTVTNLITRTYERAYDYGVGAEVGRIFDEQDVTASLRLDHEWGKESARQTGLTVGIQKRFTGTPHSLAMQAGVFERSGPLETSRHATRAMLMYRYDLGSRGYRAERLLKLTPTQSSEVVSNAASSKDATQTQSTAARTEKRIIKTTVTMTGDAFFGINSNSINDATKAQLAGLVEALKQHGIQGAIRVVGHTCDLGSDAFNLKLSVRRANAVRDYLAQAAGIGQDAIQSEGRGKAEPKYPAKPATRYKNRRVDIEFISLVDKEETITLPADTTNQASTTTDPAKTAQIEWKSEEVAQEPAWARRALRTLPGHKQNVDTYRYAKTETSTTTTRQWINRAPTASDLSATVTAGSTITIAALANASDPDGDAITLDSIGTPTLGSASISGNSISYTVPAGQAAGVDEFSYTVRDAKGAKTTARVRVTVGAAASANHAPSAADDAATVAAGSSVLINVLANDSDADGDALSLDAVTSPSVGTASIEGSSVRFTAPANAAAGAVDFNYTVRDAKGARSTGKVHVTITASSNHAPTAVDDSFYIGRLNVPTTLDVLANDSDVDGDALSIVSVTQPAGNIGTVVQDGNKLVFTGIRYFLNASFTYTIRDSKGATSTATVTLIDP